MNLPRGCKKGSTPKNHCKLPPPLFFYSHYHLLMEIPWSISHLNHLSQCATAGLSFLITRSENSTPFPQGWEIHDFPLYNEVKLLCSSMYARRTDFTTWLSPILYQQILKTSRIVSMWKILKALFIIESRFPGFAWYNSCGTEKCPLAVNGRRRQEWSLERH